MSDTDEQKDAEFGDDNDLIAEDTGEQQKALPEPEVDEKTRKGSGAVAWLALFLALVSAASVGYIAVEDWRRSGAESERADSIADLGTRLASSSEALSGLDQGLAELADSEQRLASEVAALKNELDSRAQALDSLPPRMTNLENSIASLQGISTNARNTWLLAEAEHFMQIANAQLQLAGNPNLAALALEMADERIAQLADPALTDVRRALAVELAELEVLEKPDIEGITLTLSSLAHVVGSLPLQQASANGDDEGPSVDAELSGVERAWASVKGAASGLVRVTPPNETALPLMTPDAEYFLRTNLTLQLQVARLALLRGEKAVFEQSLDDAADWLRTWFDVDSAQVASTLETLAEIRDDMVVAAAPDISESLRLLRQYRTIAETAQ